MGLRDALRNPGSIDRRPSRDSLDAPKLRPFTAFIGATGGVPLLRFAGEVVGRVYAVSVDAAEFRLTTTGHGDDEFGPYALVEEGASRFLHGFSLEIENIYDEDEALG